MPLLVAFFKRRGRPPARSTDATGGRQGENRAPERHAIDDEDKRVGGEDLRDVAALEATPLPAGRPARGSLVFLRQYPLASGKEVEGISIEAYPDHLRPHQQPPLRADPRLAWSPSASPCGVCSKPRGPRSKPPASRAAPLARLPTPVRVMAPSSKEFVKVHREHDSRSSSRRLTRVSDRGR